MICRLIAADRQAEASPIDLRRPERLERIDVVGDPAAGVVDLEHDAVLGDPGAYGQHSALGHRLHRVLGQVEQDLLDLRAVEHDRHRHAGYVVDDLHAFGHVRRTQLVEDLEHELVGRHGVGMERRPPRPLTKLQEQLVESKDLALAGPDPVDQLVRTQTNGLALHELRADVHPVEGIGDLVSEHRRGRAHRSEPFALRERPLHLPLLGDVVGDARDAGDLPRGVLVRIDHQVEVVPPFVHLHRQLLPDGLTRLDGPPLDRGESVGALGPEQIVVGLAEDVGGGAIQALVVDPLDPELAILGHRGDRRVHQRELEPLVGQTALTLRPLRRRPQPPFSKRALDHPRQLEEHLLRLDDVVHRAGLDRVHRDRLVALTGDHDERGIAPRLEERGALAVGQPIVRHDDVRFALECPDRLPKTARPRDLAIG